MKTWITKTIVVSACVLGIAGCASPVDRIAEKPHCHTDRGRNAYCTKDPAPSIAKDDEAKLFASVPEALTVYVVRYWGDGHHPLDISVDGGAAMETVPNSMIRLRLKEGTHQITLLHHLWQCWVQDLWCSKHFCLDPYGNAASQRFDQPVKRSLRCQVRKLRRRLF